MNTVRESRMCEVARERLTVTQKSESQCPNAHDGGSTRISFRHEIERGDFCNWIGGLSFCFETVKVFVYFLLSLKKTCLSDPADPHVWTDLNQIPHMSSHMHGKRVDKLQMTRRSHFVKKLALSLFLENGLKSGHITKDARTLRHMVGMVAMMVGR